jgi:hypothetical protein
MNAQVYSPNCVELDFSHLEGKGIDMLLIPIAQQALIEMPSFSRPL